MKINKEYLKVLTEHLLPQLAERFEEVPNMIYERIKRALVFTMTVNQYDEIYTALEDWLLENYEHEFRDVTISTRVDDSDDDEDSSGHQGTKRAKSRQIDKQGGYWAKYKRLFGNKPVKTSDQLIKDVQAADAPKVRKVSTQISQNAGSFAIVHNGAKIQIIKTSRENHVKDIVNMYVLTGVDAEAIKDFINSMYDDYNSHNDNAKLYICTNYGDWQYNKRLSGKTLDNVVLPDSIENSLIKDIDMFCTEKEWYNSLNIPYKRGYLLYGPPGNGKTSLSIAIANHYQRNIYCMDLNSFLSDEHMRYAFNSLENNSVLLIEDIDRAFTSQRENNDSKGITFSCLLNCLDGVFQKEGLVTIMTTNYVKQLDSALIRPGRVDMKIFIDNPSIEEVNKYLSRFYKGKADTCTEYGGGYSMAEVQEICISNKNHPEVAIAKLSEAAPIVVETYDARMTPTKKRLVVGQKLSVDNSYSRGATPAGKLDIA